MPRTARVAPGGYVFHVLNRGNRRCQIFDDDGDYAAFERVLAETLALAPLRLLAYCLMPNHWHLLLWPTADGQLGRFMQRLTVTHARRWHAHRHSEDPGGHLYQGAFKSFPVQDDPHFLTVARYVERNALRAGLVARAQDWRPAVSLSNRGRACGGGSTARRPTGQSSASGRSRGRRTGSSGSTARRRQPRRPRSAPASDGAARSVRARGSTPPRRGWA